MPVLTRWYIKSALIYLVAALLLNFVLALPISINLPEVIRTLSPAYFHLFLVGWVTQMIFGVIYWMFPIITRAEPRGNERLGWASYAFLNVGLLLRVVGEPLNWTNPNSFIGWVLPVSAVLQWCASVLFIILAWPRVKDRYRGE
jgi:heme/copper-type cytochrome/quinol oxidase subunit 1